MKSRAADYLRHEKKMKFLRETVCVFGKECYFVWCQFWPNPKQERIHHGKSEKKTPSQDRTAQTQKDAEGNAAQEQVIRKSRRQIRRILRFAERNPDRAVAVRNILSLGSAVDCDVRVFFCTRFRTGSSLGFRSGQSCCHRTSDGLFRRTDSEGTARSLCPYVYLPLF